MNIPYLAQMAGIPLTVTNGAGGGAGGGGAGGGPPGSPNQNDQLQNPSVMMNGTMPMGNSTTTNNNSTSTTTTTTPAYDDVEGSGDDEDEEEVVPDTGNREKNGNLSKIIFHFDDFGQKFNN